MTKHAELISWEIIYYDYQLNVMGYSNMLPWDNWKGVCLLTLVLLKNVAVVKQTIIALETVKTLNANMTLQIHLIDIQGYWYLYL